MNLRFLVALLLVSNLNAGQLQFVSLVVEGTNRQLLSYIPDNLPDNPVPVVLYLHAGFFNAEYSASSESVSSVLMRMADRDKFLLVYGEGTSTAGGTNLWWNDCRAYQGQPRSTNDDVRYVREVLVWARDQSGVLVDTNRQYVFGASNGGMMAMRCGIEASDVVAGVCSFIANLPAITNNVCFDGPLNSTPIFICNGSSDNLFMPWGGGEIQFGKGTVMSALSTVQYWRNENYTTTASTQSIANINLADGSTNLMFTYGGGSNNSQVRFVATYNGGHSVPSTSVYVGAFSQNRDFEGYEAAWSFIKSFTLDSRATSGSNLPVPGDYDGDGVTDYATFWPNLAVWRIFYSASEEWQIFPYGPSSSAPYVRDFDGDGKDDVGVIYTNGSALTWAHFLSAGNTNRFVSFGTIGDIPASADYDGDGRADIGIYRPSSGYWAIVRSSLGFTSTIYGNINMRPFPSDYDGDGKADISVYDFSNYSWYYFGSSSGPSSNSFGSAGYIPVPDDYFGTGKSQLALFKASSAQWVIRNPPNGDYSTTYGGSGWLPCVGNYDTNSADVEIGVFDRSTDNYWWIPTP